MLDFPAPVRPAMRKIPSSAKASKSTVCRARKARTPRPPVDAAALDEGFRADPVVEHLTDQLAFDLGGSVAGPDMLEERLDPVSIGHR